jgi:hypothetical protein
MKTVRSCSSVNEWRDIVCPSQAGYQQHCTTFQAARGENLTLIEKGLFFHFVAVGLWWKSRQSLFVCSFHNNGAPLEMENSGNSRRETRLGRVQSLRLDARCHDQSTDVRHTRPSILLLEKCRGSLIVARRIHHWGWASAGIWRRFVRMWIDPSADFMLCIHPLGVWGRVNAVYRGNGVQIQHLWGVQLPCMSRGGRNLTTIGPIGTDKLDADAFSMNPSGLTATCIYMRIGNCLVVANGGRCHVFLVQMECLGETGWSRRFVEFQTWNWYYSFHACKLAITSMNLPPCGMYLLTFDKFHWVATSDGCEFIDCMQILLGLHQNCQRSTFLRVDDDRSACWCNQECSMCFSSIMYVHKKLLLHRWRALVYSLKLSSHYCLQ